MHAYVQPRRFLPRRQSRYVVYLGENLGTVLPAERTLLRSHVPVEFATALLVCCSSSVTMSIPVGDTAVADALIRSMI